MYSFKVVTKDKNDQDCDCILGFEHVEDYQNEMEPI